MLKRMGLFLFRCIGLVALTENLILLQFEFCIDYDAEDGGKVLLKCNDVECVVLMLRENT